MGKLKIDIQVKGIKCMKDGCTKWLEEDKDQGGFKWLVCPRHLKHDDGGGHTLLLYDLQMKTLE